MEDVLTIWCFQVSKIVLGKEQKKICTKKKSKKKKKNLLIMLAFSEFK